MGCEGFYLFDFKFDNAFFSVRPKIEDLNVAIENERAKFVAVDKRQKKFDQSLAEEKAISERSESC